MTFADKAPFNTGNTMTIQRADHQVERRFTKDYNYPASPYADKANNIEAASPFYAHNHGFIPVAFQPGTEFPKPHQEYPTFDDWIADVKANGGGFMETPYQQQVPGTGRFDDCNDEPFNSVVVCAGAIQIPLLEETVIEEGDTVKFVVDPTRNWMHPTHGEIVKDGSGFSIEDYPRAGQFSCSTKCVVACFDLCIKTPEYAIPTPN